MANTFVLCYSYDRNALKHFLLPSAIRLQLKNCYRFHVVGGDYLGEAGVLSSWLDNRFDPFNKIPCDLFGVVGKTPTTKT